MSDQNCAYAFLLSVLEERILKVDLREKVLRRERFIEEISSGSLMSIWARETFCFMPQTTFWVVVRAIKEAEFT